MVVRRAKRTQHCTFCKNHALNEPKKGHQCPYSECPCLLCKLTKKAQVAMRHQQRVWRHQKQKLKNQTEEESLAARGEKPSKGGQACDKCRNHNIIKPKKNHDCPFIKCDCEYCSLTYKRREIMKHQQRVRRSRIMTQVESESSRSPAAKLGEGDEEHEEGMEERPVEKFKNVEGASNSPKTDLASCEMKIDVASSCGSPAQIWAHKDEDTEMEPLQNLSIQFSSLESEYPISPEGHSKMEMREASPAVSDFCIPSPPPLLPIEIGHPYYSEETLSRNKSITPQYPYGYPVEEYNPIQREKEIYHERIRLPQEPPLMESSQISTVMLFQNGYSSANDPHAFSPPQHVQQSAASFKISVDQLVNNPNATCQQFNDFPNRNHSRYNHAGLGSSFSNFSQASAMYLHEQRQYQFQRRQREHSVRLLPYFELSDANQ